MLLHRIARLLLGVAVFAGSSVLHVSRVAAQEAQAAVAGAEEGNAETRFRNQASLFAGGVTEEGQVAFTIGVDYERRLGRRIGVGALAEWAFGEARAGVLAAAGYWHPVERVRVVLAAGIADHQEEDEVSFLFRIGADYDFELSPRWSVEPSLNLDLPSGREASWVFGVALGYAF